VGGLRARVGDEGRDLPLVQEGGVGGREVVGDDDGALRRNLVHVGRLPEQVLDDALADVVHVGAPLLEVLVGLLVEGALDLADRALHGPLRVEPLVADEPLRLEDEHLVLEHHPVHVDDGGVLRRSGGPVGPLDLLLHLRELQVGDLERGLEPRELLLDLVRPELAPGGADAAAIHRPAAPDGDAG
jgi:hypothetical protein